MSDAAIRFDQVTRRFGRKLALDRMDLTVQPGEVIGLLGRNGAGKTTSLRLANGLLYADSGSIRTLGHDPQQEGVELRARVSLLSEESHLHPWMTVQQITDYAAGLHPHWDTELADNLTRRLDLEPGATIASLSRGTRAKVALLLALAPRPKVLLLDDPTAGLDPLVRREVLEGILETLPAEGGAVVYASHLIHDVERIADRVVFLERGRVQLDSPLETLKREVRLVTAVFEEAAPSAVKLPGMLDSTVDGRVLSVVARGNDDELTALLRAQGAKKIEVSPLPLEEILVAFLRNGNSGDHEEIDHA
jgi:ABC-2 type transport system ATP-binding protein